MIEQLKGQNCRLYRIKQNCQQQLQRLRMSNSEYENEIDTLLKFNERLLSIIENEINCDSLNKVNQLQIISQTNENEFIQQHTAQFEIPQQVLKLRNKQTYFKKEDKIEEKQNGEKQDYVQNQLKNSQEKKKQIQLNSLKKMLKNHRQKYKKTSQQYRHNLIPLQQSFRQTIQEISQMKISITRNYNNQYQIARNLKRQIQDNSIQKSIIDQISGLKLQGVQYQFLKENL